MRNLLFWLLQKLCFAESKLLVPNIALRHAINDYVDKKPSLKQLHQIALEHKSLELAIKLREDEIARSAGAAPVVQPSAKRSPEEVKALLKSLELDDYSKVLTENGCGLPAAAQLNSCLRS